MRLCLALSVALVVACHPLRESTEFESKQIEISEVQTFANVCARLRVLGCKEGQLTPEGNTCEDVLMNAAEAGIIVVSDPQCVYRADTCEAARLCE